MSGADEDSTPEWPLRAPSDALDLNSEGFGPALDPLDDTEDDAELDPDLREDVNHP